MADVFVITRSIDYGVEQRFGNHVLYNARYYVNGSEVTANEFNELRDFMAKDQCRSTFPFNGFDLCCSLRDGHAGLHHHIVSNPAIEGPMVAWDDKGARGPFNSVLSGAVDHPAHYGGADNPYEAIKVIDAWGAGFALGNALKYICRAERKGSALDDLKKARWYLDYEIQRREHATKAD